MLIATSCGRENRTLDTRSSTHVEYAVSLFSLVLHFLFVAGTFNDRLGISSETECQECLAGYFCDTPGKEECCSDTELCDAGFNCVFGVDRSNPDNVTNKVKFHSKILFFLNAVLISCQNEKCINFCQNIFHTIRILTILLFVGCFVKKAPYVCFLECCANWRCFTS